MMKFANNPLTPAKWALSLAMVGALAACGGGDDAPAAVAASSNVTAAASGAVLSALVPATGAGPIASTFANGFSGTDGTLAATPVALTGPTTVAFTGTGVNPAFAITNGGLTATGVTSFGSCIFTVGSTSPFPATSPLAAGKVFKVNPCNLTVSSNGAIANGASFARDVILTLGLVQSTPLKLPVTVSSAGVVAVNGVTVGSVTVIQTTGVTGAGN